MKYLIALCSMTFMVSAMPTNIGDGVIGNEAAAINNTNAWLGRNAGLAGFGAATRGGQGGAVWTVWDAWALRDGLNGNAPRIVFVRGRIDLTVLFTGSPGVRLFVGNFQSIIGGDRNAEIFGGGLAVSRTQHVIIQNLRITNALNYAPGERPNGKGGIISQVPGAYSSIDNIGVDQSQNVWIDHCELSDDPWNALATPEERRRHDGLLDITAAADFITVSNTIFRNHNMVTLIGNNEHNGAIDGSRLKVTYYLNWFRGTNQRNPLITWGTVHILNNLYSDIPFYAIGVRTGSSVFIERNAFFNCPRAWLHSVGALPHGNMVHLNNVFVNSFVERFPDNMSWRPEHSYAYVPMAAMSVEAHVRRYAGPR